MDKLSNEEAAERMQDFIDAHASIIGENNFDKIFYDSLRVRSATISGPGVSAKAVFECRIPPTYTNQPRDSDKKTSHGGAIATFFDMTTSMAIIACNFPAWLSTGASRKLEVTYLKPPVEGDQVLFECEVIQIGKRLAELRGVMRREADGALLATCEHQKYMADKPHYVVNSSIKL
ncbi:Putative Thioesterase domain, HotDog domain superfamily, acyl-coenzyme A thioesterase 13 [Septoria linicola]|uniref:Thioesterase domain, HotDog domain superfamily, acyl-coenzyme A thioesterase 13 n=1 Tax=Septoria linicola TaxID=215465 RepID=A0A9Q9AIY9_9PEZI|nr:putative Thioesterase domain, HotDog domain superfamily, acyl-coenzyme A thioesterase 13 [Septoria linicola]USW47038.1 Putative Thioesterase domain, HotDog domain superfamily, acyl-coenzyme A thioesterase 13 [Septoria linicola]